LPVSEFHGFLLVCIGSGKPLAVCIENGDLIVMVLPPFVRLEIRSASRLHVFSFDSRLMSAGIVKAVPVLGPNLDLSGRYDKPTARA
jgi:hypothetical protein